MSSSVDFDREGYMRKVRQFAALQRKNLGEVIRDETRLAILECAERTPPFDGAKMKGGGKKAGERATKRDVLRVFKDPRTMSLYTESDAPPGGQPGDVDVVNAFLLNAKKFKGALNCASARAQPGTERQGRVPPSRRWQAILSSSALERYVDAALMRVGYARSGWNKASYQFGAKVPGWVARHHAPGYASDLTKETETPVAEAGNTLRWIQEAGRRLKIVEHAMRARSLNLEGKIRRMVNKSFLESNV
jgi:hypothetical protein